MKDLTKIRKQQNRAGDLGQDTNEKYNTTDDFILMRDQDKPNHPWTNVFEFFTQGRIYQLFSESNELKE
jgi:hypothetical protein